MADSLFTILSQKEFDEPTEIAVIKKYVREQFEASVEVMVRNQDIIVTCASAALATALRFRLPQLKKAAHINKRIVLRIG